MGTFNEPTISVSAHSARAYTATLLVMVNVMKGGGRAPPNLTTAWASFTLMMDATLCTLWCELRNSLWYGLHLGKEDLKAFALCLLILFD